MSDPALLAALAVETGFVSADDAELARAVRRKPLCRWQDGAMATAWEKRTLRLERFPIACDQKPLRLYYEAERYSRLAVHSEAGNALAGLAALRAPGHDLGGDRWLSCRLARALDRRMLSLLAAPDAQHPAGPFSLNLDPTGILSPEFLRFDAALPGALRGQVVLELHPDDVLADPAAFAFARGFARARGYRVLLRGVSAGLLPLLDLDALAPDLAQLRWSSELGALDKLPWPPERLLLARADGPEALRWGLARGIRLFGGNAAHPTVTKLALGERAPAA